MTKPFPGRLGMLHRVLHTTDQHALAEVVQVGVDAQGAPGFGKAAVGGDQQACLDPGAVAQLQPGGIGIGIDRMVMILSGADSLRDVLAFPKIQNGACLMMETPSAVQPEQLEQLKIRCVE